MPPIASLARLTLTLAALAALAAAAQGPTAQAAAASDKSAHYFLMKQVQIIDHSQGPQGIPAYDLMIPTTWEFTGGVKFGQAVGGCFADMFSVFGDAKSADKSIELQLLPAIHLAVCRRSAGAASSAAGKSTGRPGGPETLPGTLAGSCGGFSPPGPDREVSQGQHVVSIDPFPELDQIARHRLGLPPDATGNPSGIHTECRPRAAGLQRRQGQPVEEWIAAAVVVRAIPTGGRGAAYDWHAVDGDVLPRAQGQARCQRPAVQADGQHHSPRAGVAEAQQRGHRHPVSEEAAGVGEAVGDDREVPAPRRADHQRRGRQPAARRQPCGLWRRVRSSRGVQTFRDPSTGATFELSNQYDHAWLNGSNQYVMSDDPNFNPNGTLNGNWTSLQVVRPQP